jgi:hypothetical protein
MLGIVLLIASSLSAHGGDPSNATPPGLARAPGYRGIWYSNQPTGDEHRFKYSGGMATYPQQHAPIAVYAKEANRTFFVFGGVIGPGSRRLHAMVSYYDHATGQVPRPAILLDKDTEDAHDNPTLQIDRAGHLWVFTPSHGTARTAFIHRSREPYSIDAFDEIGRTNFSYPQPWVLDDDSFLFLHTRYEKGGRSLFAMTSRDGRSWEPPRPLVRIEAGDYQISWRAGATVGTAFDLHPAKGGLNARTNLHYMATIDGGQTWRTAAGREVKLPITTRDNPALVHDYAAERQLVYLKDLQFDAEGRPVILYLTSKGFEPGPDSGPRVWHTARWDGATWVIRAAMTSDHNYDHGSFWIEPDGSWRLIAPTDSGPTPFGTGGAMVLWSTRDRGEKWDRLKLLTPDPVRNQSYARRPVNAHPDFAVIWADGDPHQPSDSHLYFTGRDGAAVYRLPFTMDADLARPERAW